MLERSGVLEKDQARCLDYIPAAFAADPMTCRGSRVLDLHQLIMSDRIDVYGGIHERETGHRDGAVVANQHSRRVTSWRLLLARCDYTGAHLRT